MYPKQKLRRSFFSTEGVKPVIANPLELSPKLTEDPLFRTET